MPKPISRLYYYETESTEWFLTTDKQVAVQGFIFRDATLDDLDDLGAIGGFIADRILNIAEGYFEWNSEAITYDNGETYGDYEVVRDLKNRVLDMMEEINMENEILYEEVISCGDWYIRKLFDNGEISFFKLVNSNNYNLIFFKQGSVSLI